MQVVYKRTALESCVASVLPCPFVCCFLVSKDNRMHLKDLIVSLYRFGYLLRVLDYVAFVMLSQTHIFGYTPFLCCFEHSSASAVQLVYNAQG